MNGILDNFGSGRAVRSLIVVAVAVAAFGLFENADQAVRARGLVPGVVPAPTPLKAADAAALVQQLKESLAENLESEDDVNAIREKWDARVVTGKTAKQILEMFFADLKTVVTDEEAQQSIWESWQSFLPEEAGNKEKEDESEQPAQPTGPPADVEMGVGMVLRGAMEPRSLTPEAGLSNEDKIKKGLYESDELKRILMQVPDWENPEVVTYKGQSYIIKRDRSDPEKELKTAGVKRGIQILIDRGIKIPSGLGVHLINDATDPMTNPICVDKRGNPYKVPYLEFPSSTVDKCPKIPSAIAYKRTLNFAPSADIIIRSTKATSPAALSGSKFNGYDKTTITIIHEIGHILHERFAGEFFWTKALAGNVRNPGPTAQAVSEYGSRSKREFVAEVFAGLIIGKGFPEGVIAEYREYRGPSSALFAAVNRR